MKICCILFDITFLTLSGIFWKWNGIDDDSEEENKYWKQKEMIRSIWDKGSVEIFSYKWYINANWSTNLQQWVSRLQLCSICIFCWGRYFSTPIQ